MEVVTSLRSVGPFSQLARCVVDLSCCVVDLSCCVVDLFCLVVLKSLFMYFGVDPLIINDACYCLLVNIVSLTCM